jgi:hypothetical protein
VTRKNPAHLGDVVGVHRSQIAANRHARRIGGTVESAGVVSLVQCGFDYSEACQIMAGAPVCETAIEMGAAS